MFSFEVNSTFWLSSQAALCIANHVANEAVSLMWSFDKTASTKAVKIRFQEAFGLTKPVLTALKADTVTWQADLTRNIDLGW